jgi:hypothetical protein
LLSVVSYEYLLASVDVDALLRLATQAAAVKRVIGIIDRTLLTTYYDTLYVGRILAVHPVEGVGTVVIPYDVGDTHVQVPAIFIERIDGADVAERICVVCQGVSFVIQSY